MSKSERTRQFIIEKAAPIINRKGMAGTSISDIMEATKMAKGGVYGNFESKEEICCEALNYLLKQAETALGVAIAAKDSYKEKLFAVIDYFKDSLTIPGHYGCPMMNFGTESDDTNPAVRQQVNKAITHTEEQIAKLVRAGIGTGEFDEGFHPGNFSVKAFAMIEGGMWISRVQGNTRQMRLISDLLKKEIEEHCK